MGKKVKEYKAGDFIFAKVKGYPAWPARVQHLNGKKYFVYFYGTGETANLPGNMIFDYAENKDKFLTKTVKRRDFNDGVKQIEYDFANNIPLDQIIGPNPEMLALADTSADDTGIDTTANETMDTTADNTMADETIADTTATTQNDTAVEDSDDAGALVIDEGKQQKGKKSKVETPKAPPKEKETLSKVPKTPRGKAKKEEQKEKEDDEDKDKRDDVVSRSGRKIRPKRYIDEQIEENSMLPSPAAKKRRGGSPFTEKEMEKEKEKPREKDKGPAKVAEKNIKHFNAVSQSELEDLKQPFKSADADKENILITYLPTGQYAGVKLFQSRPSSFKNEAAKLLWDKQAAANAITLKVQLEKGQITTQSVISQLVLDLNLTDEEKATLDKERENEEKKSRVQFLKTEMKLIELDAKIKTCLSLEKADTELCLKLLDELMALEVKPLMLLKHPTCLETVKRMRAYVGNTPSWDLSESDALLFSKQAHRIRKQADTLYKNMKDLFTTPEGLSFWEYFTERVMQFKKVTASLNADELLELVHEPLEMTTPTSHTLKSAVDAANDAEKDKKKNSSGKSKKSNNNTPSKPSLKRQSSRKQHHEDKDKEKYKEIKETEPKDKESKEKEPKEKELKEKEPKEKEPIEKESKEMEPKEKESKEKESKEKESKDKESKEKEPKDKELKEKEPKEKELNRKEAKDKEPIKNQAKDKEPIKKLEDLPEKPQENEISSDKKENEKQVEPSKGGENDKDSMDIAQENSKDNFTDDNSKDSANDVDTDSSKATEKETINSDPQPEPDVIENKKPDTDKSEEKAKTEEQNGKELKENDKGDSKSSKGDSKSTKGVEKEKEKSDIDEPRAKRSRGESKKTEQPPPRSPAKRKSKA